MHQSASTCGSGAGCLVAYLLGITNLDPIRFKLAGPYRSGGDRRLPAFDWEVSLSGGGQSIAAGLIYALYQTTIWYFQGFTAGLIAFTAAVMGGIGNLKGALLGGLLLGLVENYSSAILGSQWKDVVAFVVLLVIVDAEVVDNK